MSSSIHRKPVANTRDTRYSRIEQSLDRRDDKTPRLTGSTGGPPEIQAYGLAGDDEEQEFIALVDRAFENNGVATPPDEGHPHVEETPNVLSAESAATKAHDIKLHDDRASVAPVSTEVPRTDGSSYGGHPKPPQHLVKWGVPSLKRIQMIGYVTLGIVLAIGHHFFYLSLDMTVVGSPSRQQWAIAFGTAFAFLIARFLGLAVLTAYTQYIWAYFKKESISLSGIDKIFSLTTDLAGFFSLELFRSAKLVILFAVLSWCMKLASLLPPATLGVISWPYSVLNHTQVSTLSANQSAWTVMNTHLRYDNSSLLSGEEVLTQPAPLVLSIASEAAETFAALSLTPPATNSSYNLQFYGPSVQCDNAKDDQLRIFDYYIDSFASETLSFPSTEVYKIPDLGVQGNPGTLLYSAFSLSLLNYTSAEAGSKVDSYNNWVAAVPPDTFNDTNNQQIWIQTYRQSIVCTQVKAFFNITMNYLDGVQTISQQTVIPLNPISSSVFSQGFDQRSEDGNFAAYFSSFVALGNTLFGNISLIYAADNSKSTQDLVLKDTDSRILQTGLVACDELSNTHWDFQGQKFTATSPVSGLPWMCRNKTLSLAIQDLANNITISMLSSPYLTVANTTLVNITALHNVYAYNSRNLFISYGIAVGFACVAIAIGFFALEANGVAHSASFSAIMAATQNPDLASLLEGSSIGVMRKEVRRTRLRFGVLDEYDASAGGGGGGDDRQSNEHAGHDDDGDDGGPKHVAFGFERTVGRLVRGRQVY